MSMSQVYAKKLFSRPGSASTSEPYYFDAVINGDFNIENVIFNATDFRSGIAFRFQRSWNGKAIIGNYYNHVTSKDAENIMLADIVAASSCFPGGFEPLSFPYDFRWQDDTVAGGVRRPFPVKRGEQDDATHSAL